MSAMYETRIRDEKDEAQSDMPPQAAQSARAGSKCENSELNFWSSSDPLTVTCQVTL